MLQVYSVFWYMCKGNPQFKGDKYFDAYQLDGIFGQ